MQLGFGSKSLKFNVKSRLISELESSSVVFVCPTFNLTYLVTKYNFPYSIRSLYCPDKENSSAGSRHEVIPWMSVIFFFHKCTQEPIMTNNSIWHIVNAQYIFVE